MAAILVAVGGYFLWKRLRQPKDPEQHRRLRVSATGRIIEGTINDVRDGHIYYSWTWRGVVYEASQDVRAIEHLLPPESHLLIGQTSIKFLPGNPHNSVVMSENWSGFRLPGPSRLFHPGDTPI
ncbi:MAG: hypothetical protein SGI92_07905 [Bryobacteraceae bacterium]|nr:hypothetical protein [Bryobacteraceae bacterium]